MATILIIDDEETIRAFIHKALSREGHTVVEAADGTAGIKRYREQPVDLVITDIFMPEKDGIETVAEFQQLFPDAKILAISGGGRLGSLHYLDIAEKLGAIRTLAKPFDPRTLRESVAEILAA